jgi:hypothetical protein
MSPAPESRDRGVVVIHSTRLTWVVVIGAFLWLGVLFVLTFADYLTRMWSLY